jgi:hypothetical protein
MHNWNEKFFRRITQRNSLPADIDAGKLKNTITIMQMACR